MGLKGKKARKNSSAQGSLGQKSNKGFFARIKYHSMGQVYLKEGGAARGVKKGGAEIIQLKSQQLVQRGLMRFF